MKYRTIYQIEAFTESYDIKARRYARNKQAADRIARQYENASVRKLRKDEHMFVSPEWVEA